MFIAEMTRSSRNVLESPESPKVPVTVSRLVSSIKSHFSEMIVLSDSCDETEVDGTYMLRAEIIPKVSPVSMSLS